MKKVISLVGILFLASIILVGCSSGATNESNSQKDGDLAFGESEPEPGMPYLKMTIVDYPKVIDTMCQSVTFTLEVENIGDTSLKYEDFADKYTLNIESDNAVSSFEDYPQTIVDTSSEIDDDGLITYKKIIEDFGEIKPGEKGTIVFHSLSYVGSGQYEYYWINAFQVIKNGTFEYFFLFGEQPEDKSMFASDKEISISSLVSIATSIYSGENEYDFCDYEVITDTSIDFYDF